MDKNNMKYKLSLMLFFATKSLLFPNELDEIIYLPLIKEHKNKKICYIFSSKIGKPISSLECEDIGKQSKDLIPVKFKSKWGFVNSEGIWVITPEYDFADNFYSNLARVKKNNKFGFIDKRGNLIIEFKFLYAGNFFEGEDYAPYQCGEEKNYLFGYINKKGNVIIPCEFQMAYDFRNHVAKARKWDLYGYISFDSKNKTKRILQNFSFRLAGDFGNFITYVFRDDFFYYISVYGKTIKKLEPHFVPGNFSVTDPLGIFQDLTTGYYGYIDTSINIVIPPIFLEAEEFYLGYAKVIGPSHYQNIDDDSKRIITQYREKLYEEFYINRSGKRITMWN